MGMENLEQKMSDMLSDINNSKIAIADLFVELIDAKPMENMSYSEFSLQLEGMEKLHLLKEELEKKQARYQAMMDTKRIIESGETEVLIKQ